MNNYKIGDLIVSNSNDTGLITAITEYGTFKIEWTGKGNTVECRASTVATFIENGWWQVEGSKAGQ